MGSSGRSPWTFCRLVDFLAGIEDDLGHFRRRLAAAGNWVPPGPLPEAFQLEDQAPGSAEARYFARQLSLLLAGEVEAVWFGDGHHRGCTLFRSRGPGVLHCYSHEAREFHEACEDLALIEGCGTCGDVTGLNQFPGLLGVDFDCQLGLWLVQDFASLDLPANHVVVWSGGAK